MQFVKNNVLGKFHTIRHDIFTAKSLTLILYSIIITLLLEVWQHSVAKIIFLLWNSLFQLNSAFVFQIRYKSESSQNNSKYPQRKQLWL